MACERNRILELIAYLKSLGIKVNIGKNKARGNQGFFRVKNGEFRIDIAKGLSEESVLRILVHEFIHFVHYNYDKSLKSLDFIFEELNDDLTEEMISLTVHSVSRKSVEPLFKAKEHLKSEIKKSSNVIFQLSAKRALNNINSRISRLNRYYNSPTELLARSWEYYIVDKDLVQKKAPGILNCYNDVLNNDKIPMLTNFVKIINKRI